MSVLSFLYIYICIYSNIFFPLQAWSKSPNCPREGESMDVLKSKENQTHHTSTYCTHHAVPTKDNASDLQFHLCTTIPWSHYSSVFDRTWPRSLGKETLVSFHVVHGFFPLHYACTSQRFWWKSKKYLIQITELILVKLLPTWIPVIQGCTHWGVPRQLLMAYNSALNACVSEPTKRTKENAINSLGDWGVFLTVKETHRAT